MIIVQYLFKKCDVLFDCDTRLLFKVCVIDYSSKIYITLHLKNVYGIGFGQHMEGELWSGFICLF